MADTTITKRDDRAEARPVFDDMMRLLERIHEDEDLQARMAQVAHMSNQLALEPGDVISTGTPNGIGIYTGIFIKTGDLIECEIDGFGVQRNRLVAE